MTGDGVTGKTLHWTGHEALSPELKTYLLGPGGPFEQEMTWIGGREVKVFVQRATNMRAHFENGVAKHGTLPYLAFPAATHTYKQVGEMVARTARVLMERFGVGKGDRVAIASANCLEHVVTVWSLLSIGAVAVELNAWWTPAELSRALDLTTPVLVLSDDKRAESVRRAAGHRGHQTWGDLTQHAEGAYSTGPPDIHINEADPAAVLFTSGTTGAARGVTLSHANLVNFSHVSGLAGAVGVLSSGRAAPTGQHAAFSISPLFHVSGFGPVFSNSPMFGSKLVFPGPGGYDERRQLALTQQHAITSWSGVPTVFLRLLNTPFFDQYDTSTVTNLGVGGSNASPDLLALIHQRLPQASVTNGYGMTETTGMGTFLSDSDLLSDPESVGRVVPGTEAQLRDESGTVLAEGEVGEIYLRGASVFTGYWADPGATSAVIDADGWYRTSDYGRISGEVMQLQSRMRDLILRGGENVYPIEVENRLSAHPSIAEVAVIGMPDPMLGQEVVAIVVLRPGVDELKLEDLRNFAAEQLAPFKLPTRLLVRPHLPYGPTGKVLKRELEDELRVGLGGPEAEPAFEPGDRPKQTSDSVVSTPLC